MRQESTKPTGATVGGSGQDIPSVADFSTDGRALQAVSGALFSLGAFDQDHAASTDELCGRLGLSDSRQLRVLISEERKHFPICSQGRGYFLSSLRTEQGRAAVLRSSRTIFRRGVEGINTARRLDRLLEPSPDQLSLEMQNEQPQETIPEEDLRV